MNKLLLLLPLILMLGCTNQTSNSVTGSAVINGAEVTVEVIHFHSTQQCYSCIRVGELAELTVSKLSNPRISFAHVNGQLTQNRDLVMKYGATGSSIWIGTTINGVFQKEQNINVWYKLNNEADFIDYFSNLLTKRLNGDLS